jgi:hypothetical protein
MANNIFGLGQSLKERQIPSYTNYGGTLNMQGLADQVNAQPLAGRYSTLDPAQAKSYTDMFGKEIGPFAYMLDQKMRYESDPQRLKEQLEVLGPYLKDVAQEKQRLGMEANVFAGLMNLPNKWQEAMSEKYRFSGPIVDMVRQGAQRTTANPFGQRQYINI